MRALQDFATDPRLKANMMATTQNIADTTQTLAALTKDLRTVTGNPQTQAQMRDTIANLDAVLQKANSLLGELGGTSNVYGVDAGATPGAPRGAERLAVSKRRIRTVPAPARHAAPASRPRRRPSCKESSPSWRAIWSPSKCA